MRTKYNERTAIQTLVCAQTRETFYVKHGDYIARIAVVLAALGLLLAIWGAVRPSGRIRRVKEK
jgi:apolipoprotein N-acyltransferase